MLSQTSTPPAPDARPFGREQLRDLPEVRVIPYDYVAELELSGIVGNLVQDVVNISVEGVFVAVSIGYGLDQELGDEVELVGLEPPPDPSTGAGYADTGVKEVRCLGDVELGNVPPDVWIEGFRLHPDLAPLVRRHGLELPFEAGHSPLQRLGRAESFGFLLNVVDSGSGRELQNEPVHSLATLGGHQGRRPFKMLPQPMVFMPRSTIRIQIEERTAGVRGRLVVTLQGYKVLGQSGRIEAEVRRLERFDPRIKIPAYDHALGDYRRWDELRPPDLPDSGIVPFDYVSTLDLLGQPGRQVADEVPVNVDGGYVATALGYSLDAGETTVEIAREEDPVDLGSVRLRDVRPVEALIEGIRLHPLRVRFAFGCGGVPATVPQALLQRLFQRLNLPEAVSFRYSITDSGTGRELQSQPILNVAGLGIADGERPFRVLHKPMVFLPRSTIRVEVEERFGIGRLYLVFQGYKLLR